jgi:uncharacterized protein (TIGR02145 family)
MKRSVFLSATTMFLLIAVYCNQDSLSPDGNSVTDIEGNVYKTVTIGNQVWTAENLRTTMYNDGTPITLDTAKKTWAGMKVGKCCYPINTNNPDTIAKLGALYNWYAIDTKKLAPKGWHVATMSDWETLKTYLITNKYNWDESTDSNRIAKALAATSDWPTTDTSQGAIGYNLAKNNKSGFSAIPGGARDGKGELAGIGGEAFWFSATGGDGDNNGGDSTNAFVYSINSSDEYLYRWYGFKVCAFSVRLVKD